MAKIEKDLGAVTAYAYAVEHGFVGTEEEFGEVLAHQAETAQQAAESAAEAKASAEEADGYAGQADGRATDAAASATAAFNSAQAAANAVGQANTAASAAAQSAGAAQTYQNAAEESAGAAAVSAGEASESATAAAGSATEAAGKATEAGESVTAAETAKTAAETAQGKAEDAQAAAEEAAASIDPKTLVHKDELDDLVVGNAKQLVATVGINDNAPYLFRTSGGTADIGDRETDEIVGGTVAWNQLVGTNPSSWVKYASELTFENGEYTLTATSGATHKAEMNLLANRVFLFGGSVKTDGSGSARFGINDNTGANTSVITADSDTYVSGYKIYKTSEDMKFVLRLANAAQAGDYAKFKGIQLFDLTLMFGTAIADYVYSLETATAGAGIAWLNKYWFFNKPYYPYNAGQLISVKTSAHKMVGFNAFKGNDTTSSQYVDHSYITSNGSISANNSYNRFRIRVVPSTKYCLSVSSGTLVSIANIRYVNENYDFISYSDIGSGQIKKTFTTPSNCRYVEFALATNESRNACFNLSWDGERDGEYAPYEEWVYPLDDDLELRGIPKLDANNNLYCEGDVYSSDGTVIRTRNRKTYASADVAAVSGSYTNVVYYAVSKPSGSKGTGTAYCYAKSNKYLMMSSHWEAGASSWDDAKCIGIAFGAHLYSRYVVGFAAGTTLEQAKAALNGWEVEYQLATPTTESAESYTNPQIVDDFGTEEYIDEREVPIPVGHNTIYSANLRAKLEMAPDSPDGDGDYIVRQTNGTNEYVPLPANEKTPAPPTADGVYKLTCTISGGTAVYSWESVE